MRLKYITVWPKVLLSVPTSENVLFRAVRDMGMGCTVGQSVAESETKIIIWTQNCTRISLFLGTALHHSSPKCSPTCYSQNTRLQFLRITKVWRAWTENPTLRVDIMKRVALKLCVCRSPCHDSPFLVHLVKQAGAVLVAVIYRSLSVFTCVFCLVSSSAAARRGFKALRLQTERGKVGYGISLGGMTLYLQVIWIVAVL